MPIGNLILEFSFWAPGGFDPPPQTNNQGTQLRALHKIDGLEVLRVPDQR